MPMCHTQNIVPSSALQWELKKEKKEQLEKKVQKNGEESLSTADPGAGAGCNCQSWCEEGPRAGAGALGKTISLNRPPREDREPI